MALGQRLQIRQTTRLVLTPQLRQAIRLLQMSNLELSTHLAEEIERNPLLEIPDGTGERAAEATAPELPLEQALREATPATAEIDAPEGSLYDEAVADAQAGWTSASSRLGPSAQGGLDLLDGMSEPPSLRAHLLEQIGCMAAPTPVAGLAALLVDELDEDGYLRGEHSEIAARHGASDAQMQAALALLRRCEPTGVGARDLADCLGLQLAARDRLDPAMETLLASLDLLAAHRHDRLLDLLGLDREDLAEMIGEIRALNPRPGLAFRHEPSVTLVPDVLIRRGPDGDWLVELNEETLPRLVMNGAYAARVAASGAAAKSFVADCRSDATWLMRALDQRARTILRVASEIVRRQAGFFARGVSGLRPMTLRDIAESVNMHESTVSRVTSGKYLSCERGLYELRFFFSTGLAGQDGESTSATVIRDIIRRLIEGEDPRRPLSDDTLVTELKRQGIDIARRTVAKYREGMRIPSSVRRRRTRAEIGR